MSVLQVKMTPALLAIARASAAMDEGVMIDTTTFAAEIKTTNAVRECPRVVSQLIDKATRAATVYTDMRITENYRAIASICTDLLNEAQ